MKDSSADGMRREVSADLRKIMEELEDWPAFLDYHPAALYLRERYPEDVVGAVLRTSGNWGKWRWYVAYLTGEDLERLDEVWKEKERLLREIRRVMKKYGVRLKRKGLWGLPSREIIKGEFSPPNLLRLVLSEEMFRGYFPYFWGDRGSYFKWKNIVEIDPRKLARPAELPSWGLFSPPDDPGEPWTEVYKGFLFHPLSDLDIKTKALGFEEAVRAWRGAMEVERRLGTRVSLPGIVPFSREILSLAAAERLETELKEYELELMRRRYLGEG